MGWAIYSFYPIAVFPVLEAPKWRKGYSVDICFIFGCWITLMIGFWLQRRDEKKQQRLSRGDEEGSAKTNDPELIETTNKAFEK
jgi:hypothetical protein